MMLSQRHRDDRAAVAARDDKPAITPGLVNELGEEVSDPVHRQRRAD